MNERERRWSIAGEPGSEDAVAALSRGRATLWYGSHCLAYSRTHDDAGNFLLRLQAVGHRLPADFEAPILVLGDGGETAQQLIAPDGERAAADVVQHLGRATVRQGRARIRPRGAALMTSGRSIWPLTEPRYPDGDAAGRPPAEQRESLEASCLEVLGRALFDDVAHLVRLEMEGR